MSWRVDWTPGAYRDLAEIWLVVADKDRFSRKIHRMEQEIFDDASEAGESRTGEFRVIMSGPIVILFLAEKRLSLATVIKVRYAPRR